MLSLSLLPHADHNSRLMHVRRFWYAHVDFELVDVLAIAKMRFWFEAGALPWNVKT